MKENTKIISGTALSKKWQTTMRQAIQQLDHPPCLTIFLVGDNPASHIYVAQKQKIAKKMGMICHVKIMPSSTRETELLDAIDHANKDVLVHGIIVQLPLPKHMNVRKIIDHIAPIKDVDGLGQINTGKLYGIAKNSNQSIFEYLEKNLDVHVPCTALACISLLRSMSTDLSGKHAAVIGCSQLVGRPTAHLLLHENCSVTILHSRSNNIPSITCQCDIIIAAAGCPKLIKRPWVKKGAFLIDVGITRLDDGRISGDIDFDDVFEDAGAITSVPGGVGPMTVTFLLYNTIRAARYQLKK